MKDVLQTNDGAGATISVGSESREQANAAGVFKFTCVKPDGTVRWEEVFDNTVMTAGKNDLLDKYLAGSTYTAAFYLGLISSTGYSAISAADTSASHAGWQEAGNANAPAYSQANRPTVTWNAASGGNKTVAAALAFSVTSNGTAKGAFLTTSFYKDSSNGTLFSAGLFTQGDRVVVNGDTINGSYTLGV